MPQHAETRSCGWVLERLEAWIDGELSESEHASVTTHIEGCESCQRERLVAEAVVTELRALPEFELSEDVVQAVARRTHPSVMERLSSYFEGAIRRPLPVVATLAAIVATIVIVSPWRSVSGPEYSEQEITRATNELRMAFAYVGAITRRAELRATERVLDQDVAQKTMRGVRRSLQIIGEAGTVVGEPPAPPQQTAKGS